MPSEPEQTSPRPERRLAAILAADIVGYSRLMGLDEEGTHARSRQMRNEVIGPNVQNHRGRVFKTTGDGFLVEFSSAVEAVACASAIQAALAQRDPDLPAERRIALRIGINLGDVIVEAGDVHGDGVNVAARLESLAEPGSVFLSGDVHSQVHGRLPLSFVALGERQLKNINRQVTVYRIGVPGATADLGARERSAVAADKPSIAVLPFQNMSGDPEQEYFADGIVEDITTALSRFKELFVIARNSSFVYKGRAIDIQQVARELGVRYVLEGSIRKAGSRVRITGQLIDAATRAHLWADRFDGGLEDVFELQDRVTENVVGALAPTLRQAEIERAWRKLPASLDAYDYLLRAMPHVIANTPGETPEAIRLLNEALRLDPDYAYAHALLALVYGQVFRSAVGPAREEARAQGTIHGRQAILLGADDSAALANAGFALLITAQDVGTARANLDRAVMLNSNSATALTFRSLVLSMTGEAQAAINDASKALRLSPLDPGSFLPHMGIVVARLWLGEYDEAARSARQAIEKNPRYPMAYAWLMVAECARGDTAEAQAQFQRLAEIIPNFGPDGLAKLFEMFPPVLRGKALGALRAGGLVPGE
jgi:TolB-like protein/class 3 adenylate cyclase/Tfp pilus assembly protein PilF